MQRTAASWSMPWPAWRRSPCALPATHSASSAPARPSTSSHEPCAATPTAPVCSARAVLPCATSPRVGPSCAQCCWMRGLRTCCVPRDASWTWSTKRTAHCVISVARCTTSKSEQTAESSLCTSSSALLRSFSSTRSTMKMITSPHACKRKPARRCLCRRWWTVRPYRATKRLQIVQTIVTIISILMGTSTITPTAMLAVTNLMCGTNVMIEYV
mmetsp:Transcript_51881/g.90530  ORF Transcript_51881/g.90530 Transcript_51881/m.90530 type:complete len:214 (+) Transcript_51881:1126-1767(+)